MSNIIEYLQDVDPDLNFLNIFNQEYSSNYYTIQDYLDLNTLNRDLYNLFLLNFNIRSFLANLNEFEAFLDSLSGHPDILVISETWITSENKHLCNIEGFNSFHTIRKERRGGGIAIYVSNRYIAEKVDCVSVCGDDFEICCVNFEFFDKSFVILGIYRPPSGNIENFISELENVINSHAGINKTIIIAGDINLNLTDANSTQVNNYLSLLHSYSFLPAITKPTRFPSGEQYHAASTLDHIFYNNSLNTWSGIIYNDITDHCPTFLKINLAADNINRTRKFEFRPYSEEKFQNLKYKLNNICWDSVLSSTDVDTSFGSFIETINSLYCQCFPLKVKFISEKRLSKPWLSPFILSQIKLKSVYFKNFKNGLITLNVYRNFRNKINKLITNAKNSYYINRFKECKNNIKKTWDIINNLAGRKQNRDSIQKLFVNENLVTNEQNIADSFIEHFCNIANDLDHSLPCNNISPIKYVNSCNLKSFYLFPVSINECINLISDLKITKSEVHKIPVKIFKSLKEILAYPISKLLNLSFKYGKFPKCMKQARLTPIFKKGDKLNANNYRPIASLPYLSKIIERCITNRILKFYEHTNFFSKFQFGFRKGKSTTLSLIELTENIYKSLNSKDYHLSVFIDLTKAFDTVNHQILLKKLELSGIRGIVLDWFSSYLLNREYFVKIGSFSSCSKFVNIGLPQGSILGPILFLVYINDLPNVSNIFESILFADDTTVSFSDPNLESLISKVNFELKKIESWTISNRLTINAEKTEVLFITKSPVDREQCKVILGNKALDFKNSCKFLGVFVDNKLNFRDHINHVVSKLSRNSGILFKIRGSLPLAARIDFYNAFIYPYLTYNVIIWGGTNAVHINRIINQQKRIIRIICDAKKFDHTTPLFSRLGLLKFLDIYKFYICVHMHKFLSSGNFRINHNINTRNSNLALPSFHRLTTSQQAFSYCGPSIWNTLPKNLREIKSLKSFKISVKLFLLDRY